MRTSSQKIGDFAGYLTLRLVVGLVQAMPLSACDRLARMLAWLFCDLLRFRRQVVDENLQTAFPEWSAQERHQCARSMWRHLFLMVTEIAHTPRKMHRTNWRSRYDVPQVETIVRQLLDERPKVIISGHYGNFELGGYLLGLFGFSTHTVARAIDNPYVDKFVNDFRGRTGQYMLPKSGSRDAIERVLNQGGILALLGDQSAGEKACWVEFFGRPASTHKAVSLFTLTYQAPTIVLGVRRNGGPLHYEGVLAGCVGSARRRLCLRHYHRYDQVVYRPPGRTDPLRPRAILVGPSTMERGATCSLSQTVGQTIAASCLSLSCLQKQSAKSHVAF